MMLARPPRPDFLRPVRGAAGWAWLALALALAVLGDAVHDAVGAWQAVQAVAPAPVALPAAAPTPPPDAEQQRALRQAHARLDRPWSAAFVAIEALQHPGLRWLALDIGERGQLRLEGLAPDTGTAIAVAEMLRRQPAWRDAVPGRIESDGTAGAGVRFELSATLAGAAP